MSAINDRRAADGDPDDLAVASPRRRADDWLRAIRMWCRLRARRKSDLAKRIAPLRHQGLAHEEIRTQLGLTVDDYRRVRRWMDDAMKESLASAGEVSFDEALLLHENRQVDLVSRFALLKRQGATREQIRARLKLSHDGYALTSEWFRDAVAATRRER